MKFIDFYIRSSIHVSLAVVSLTQVTYYLFGIPTAPWVLIFVFCSTLVGYNYTKGTNLLSLPKTYELLMIQIITLDFFILGIWSFFELNFKSQILAGIIAFCTIFYATTIFNGKNIRNQSRIKIYPVTLCWVGTTLFLPLFQAEYFIDFDVAIIGIQRFLFVITLILIFEIIDLKQDALRLKTVPQTIGIKNTKIISVLLLIVFFGLEFLHTNIDILINGILSMIILLFVLFASGNRSKYYTTFWVESIPITWFFLLYSSICNKL